MLSPYMSPVERVWFYSLRILCGLVLLFLVLPVLVIMLLHLALSMVVPTICFLIPCTAWVLSAHL